MIVLFIEYKGDGDIKMYEKINHCYERGGFLTWKKNDNYYKLEMNKIRSWWKEEFRE